jgi:hypothetical protein
MEVGGGAFFPHRRAHGRLRRVVPRGLSNKAQVKHQTARWPDMKLTRSCDLLHGSICLLSAHFQAPGCPSFARHAIACFYSFHGCTVDLSCSAA